MRYWSCEPRRSALLTVGRLAVTAVLSVDWAIAMPAQAAAGATEAQQQKWVRQAAADLPPRALATLQRIAGADRRLLAVRAYLRAGSSLDERWSWSQQQLDSYPTTAEAKLAAADIDAVIAAFSAANPGFTLGVNRLPRSLEAQIAHWNENRSVGIAAAALVAALDTAVFRSVCRRAGCGSAARRADAVAAAGRGRAGGARTVRARTGTCIRFSGGTRRQGDRGHRVGLGAASDGTRPAGHGKLRAAVSQRRQPVCGAAEPPRTSPGTTPGSLPTRALRIPRPPLESARARAAHRGR
jgi:hypothetical protein